MAAVPFGALAPAVPELVAAPQAPTAMPGGQARLTGRVIELRRDFAWIEPLQAVQHPAARWNRGRIFLSFEDVRSGRAPLVGDLVEFSLYADKKGLGAEDCTPLPKGPADSAQASTCRPAAVAPPENSSYCYGYPQSDWSNASKWSSSKSWKRGKPKPWASWNKAGSEAAASKSELPPPRQSQLAPAELDTKEAIAANLRDIFSDSEDSDEDGEQAAFPTVCGTAPPDWSSKARPTARTVAKVRKAGAASNDEETRCTASDPWAPSPIFSDKTLSTVASPSEALLRSVKLYHI